MTEAAAAATTTQADAGAAKPADAAKVDAGAKPEAGKADASQAVEFKLPDEFKAKDGQPDVAKIVGRLSEFEAERNARGLPPESADKYEFAAPKDLKLPDGSPAEIDVDSDIFKQFRQVAFDLKLPQAAAQKLFELGVEREFGLMAQADKDAKDALAAEMVKLGSKHEQRINSVGNWFKSHFGQEGAQFLETLSKAEQVFMLEKLVAKFGGAGAAGASNASSAAAKPENNLSSIYPTMVKQ